MLKKIKCEKFSNHIFNKTIYFQKGLNCVVGANDALNSIGKSSLLLIIDFCFGGNTYCAKDSDIRQNIGDHFILFTFEFDDIEYHFCRDTADSNYFYECDDSYNKTSNKKPISDLCAFLKEKYFGFSAKKSFRALVDVFSRVYGKKNYEVNKPLKTHANDATDENGINVLVDLFGKTSIIEKSIEKVSEAKKAKKAMDEAQKYNIVYSPIKTISDLKFAKQEIKRLQDEVELMIKEQNMTSLGIDENISQKDIDLKSEQICLYKEKKTLSIHFKALQEMTGDSLLMDENDRQKLVEFFPDIDVKPIFEINEFQKRLSENVNQEVNDQKEDLSNKINVIQKKIDEINTELLQNNISPRIPKTFLDTIYEKRKQIQKLEDQVFLFEKVKSFKERARTISQQMNKDYGYVLSEMENDINTKLKELNDNIYLEERIPPYLNLKDFSHYSYKTPNDKGTGTEYKSLILFDLTILDLTFLPFIINDSMLFKNIWDEPVEGLFKLYNKAKKQIFIAIDRINVFSFNIQKIITNHEVAKLGKDDQTLFGFTWSKK